MKAKAQSTQEENKTLSHAHTQAQQQARDATSTRANSLVSTNKKSSIKKRKQKGGKKHGVYKVYSDSNTLSKTKLQTLPVELLLVNFRALVNSFAKVWQAGGVKRILGTVRVREDWARLTTEEKKKRGRNDYQETDRDGEKLE